MSDGANDLIGRTLGGRFRVTAFLGEGAMAAVYRAEQDAEPREVAVKVMHRELLRDVTFAKRFVREARAAASIEHPNSVRILEHGTDGDALYLAMELLVGQDLFDVLARDRRLPEARAVRIVMAVCSALAAAHDKGIVHRDLKPENVMIVRDPASPGGETVKVLDFGIAKIVERDRLAPRDDPPSSEEPMSMPPSSVLTRVGAIIGTPEYMAPEQATGLPIDARSDVYSCGVLLFHAVTGRAPFTGATPIDVIVQVTQEPPPRPSTLLPSIHPKLEAIILKTLAKLPDDRFQSARELGRELAAILPELSGAAGHKPTPASGVEISGLPGVPGEVTISSEGSAELPPVTLRSSVVNEPADPPAAEDPPKDDALPEAPADEAHEDCASALPGAPLAAPARDERIAPGWVIAIAVAVILVAVLAMRALGAH